MKRTRFGARDRVSRDAAELQRLATGLSQSGCKLEDDFWIARLSDHLDGLLKNGGEDDLNTALDRLFDSQPAAHDKLADMIEWRAESHTRVLPEQSWDIQLFAAPLLAWSRFSIAACPLPGTVVDTLAVQLGAHVFSRSARVALADYLFSPDQLPRSFCDTWQLSQLLGDAALSGQNLTVDSSSMPETNRFLSDVRYVIGVVAVPQGDPLFRWNEKDGNREEAQREWLRQGAPALEGLLTGCLWQALLPDAYHAACRQADRLSRPYSVEASVAFLQTALGLAPDAMQAVIGPCYDQRMEEYRISLGPADQDAVYHGVVWPLLGAEDESTDVAGEIETALRQAGIVHLRTLDHRLPMEFCDDCGAPLFPNADGEMVHAEMPESPAGASQSLH